MCNSLILEKNEKCEIYVILIHTLLSKKWIFLHSQANEIEFFRNKWLNAKHNVITMCVSISYIKTTSLPYKLLTLYSGCMMTPVTLSLLLTTDYETSKVIYPVLPEGTVHQQIHIPEYLAEVSCKFPKLAANTP